MEKEKKEGEVKGPSMEAAKANNEGSGFKFNVDAPEFVPRSFCPLPSLSGYYSPYLQFSGNGGAGMGPDWSFFVEHKPMSLPDFHVNFPSQLKSNVDVVQKIVKQVEYQFSDTNLLANDFLIKIMNKDPEGYVPMTIIASWKKIKSLGVSNQMLIKALRTSTKLAVSDDGKKIRRKQLFTDRDKEELQSRTIMVENLPEDCSRQNLEKIFSVAGSVKNIRICHPQEPNPARSSKSDVLISNKLHALVEYETADQADKAVEKLNDERNWRKGLHVRTMLRRSPRSVIRNKRPDFDNCDSNSEDDQSPMSQSAAALHAEQMLEQNMEDYQNVTKKGWGRGRAKAPGQTESPRSTQFGTLGVPESLSNKQATPSPRMPNGTRGFTMGRGKPVASIIGNSPLKALGLTPIKS